MSQINSTLHPIVISQVMVNFAAKYGIDKKTCLLDTDITEQQLADAEALINRSQEIKLVENLISALPTEPSLGFKLGLLYSVSTFGVWGFALRTCRTLRDAISVALRYLPLSTAYCHIQEIEENGHFGVMFDADQIETPLRQFFLERDMATSVNILKELGLSGVSCTKVEFRGPPSSYAKYFEDVLGIKPTFNSDRNALFISSAEADKKLSTYDSQLVHLMHDQCRQQLKLRQQSGITGKVRQQILGPLGFTASCEDVSSILAMSSRSLRRKLDHEGTSFKLLLDTERQLSAVQLLNNTDMKLDEIAFHLGYYDTASFARAFRRWQNCTPAEYRKSAN